MSDIVIKDSKGRPQQIYVVTGITGPATGTLSGWLVITHH
jgi:hypothetical protein